jgi:hypothetical protein
LRKSACLCAARRQASLFLKIQENVMLFIWLKGYIKTYIKKTGSNTSGTISFTYTKKMLESAAADSTKPCVWTKSALEIDCSIYQLTTVEYSDSRYHSDIELIKITAYKGLRRSDSGIYFTNGTMDIVYNDCFVILRDIRNQFSQVMGMKSVKALA